MWFRSNKLTQNVSKGGCTFIGTSQSLRDVPALSVVLNDSANVEFVWMLLYNRPCL